MERAARLVVLVMLVAGVVFGGVALAANRSGPTMPGKGCGDKNHVHYNEASCKP